MPVTIPSRPPCHPSVRLPCPIYLWAMANSQALLNKCCLCLRSINSNNTKRKDRDPISYLQGMATVIDSTSTKLNHRWESSTHWVELNCPLAQMFLVHPYLFNRALASITTCSKTRNNRAMLCYRAIPGEWAGAELRWSTRELVLPCLASQVYFFMWIWLKRSCDRNLLFFLFPF